MLLYFFQFFIVLNGESPSVGSNGLDDLLFDMYKKQVCMCFVLAYVNALFISIWFFLCQDLKHLRSKINTNMLRTLEKLKVD